MLPGIGPGQQHCPTCGQFLKRDWTTKTNNFTTTVDPVTGRSTQKCSTCNVFGKRVKVGAMIDNLALVQKGDTSVQEVLRVLKGGGEGDGGTGGGGGATAPRRPMPVAAMN